MKGNETALQELEIRISFLERHIQEQDHEMMRLNKLIDTLTTRLEQTELKVSHLSESRGESRLNEHEKPPHY